MLASNVQCFFFLSGSTPEEEDVSGTITVPEVAHDTEEDEYVVRRPRYMIINPKCILVAL